MCKFWGGQTFRTQTFQSSMVQPRKFRLKMFQTGLFSRVDMHLGQIFFYKKYFLCYGFYFHKRMNGKNIYYTSFLSTFITTVKTFIVYHFCNTTDETAECQQ